MRLLIHKIIEFYVYSSLHIALCAAALILYSYQVFELKPNYSYAVFVASCTMILYAVHRLVGLRRVSAYHNLGRFQVVLSHKTHLYFYIGIAGVIAIILALNMSIQKIQMLLIPSVLSLLYVLPVLKGRRLRDLAYIKIFIIALCWSWLCCVIPTYAESEYVVFALGKCFFIFGITIPFDIRDRQVDVDTGVRTLATMYDHQKVKLIGIIACLVSLGLSIAFFPTFLLSEIIVHFIAIGLIWRASADKSDYYFSLFTDGTMALFYITSIIIQEIK